MKYWDSDKNGTVDYDVRSSYMIMLTLLKEFVNGLKYEHRKMRVSSVRRTLKKAPSFETSSPNVSVSYVGFVCELDTTHA